MAPGKQPLSMLLFLQPVRRTDEVSPGHMDHKVREFRLWALEVHHTVVGELDDKGRLHLFGQYMDAYNARQLPLEKYYDLDAWEEEERVGAGCCVSLQDIWAHGSPTGYNEYAPAAVSTNLHAAPPNGLGHRGARCSMSIAVGPCDRL